MKYEEFFRATYNYSFKKNISGNPLSVRLENDI